MFVIPIAEFSMICFCFLFTLQFSLMVSLYFFLCLIIIDYVMDINLEILFITIMGDVGWSFLFFRRYDLFQLRTCKQYRSRTNWNQFHGLRFPRLSKQNFVRKQFLHFSVSSWGCCPLRSQCIVGKVIFGSHCFQFFMLWIKLVSLNGKFKFPKIYICPQAKVDLEFIYFSEFHFLCGISSLCCTSWYSYKIFNNIFHSDVIPHFRERCSPNILACYSQEEKNKSGMDIQCILQTIKPN